MSFDPNKLKPNPFVASIPSDLTDVWCSSGNCCQNGQRIPAIFMHSGTTRLHITNSVNGNGNHVVNKDIPMGKYTKVTIQQVERSDGVYVYSIYLNEKGVFSIVNTQPQEFDNVKLYASDNFYPASKADLKDFNFKSPFFGK